jgi:hypothetical protein
MEKIVTYPFVKVAELPEQTIYAQRTLAGGIAYFTDECGVMSEIVDMTVVDEYTLKIIIELHNHLGQRSISSTGTRFDIMEMKEREAIKETGFPIV